MERGTDNDNLLSNNFIFYAGICLVILLFPAKESFKMVLFDLLKTNNFSVQLEPGLSGAVWDSSGRFV